MPPPPPSSPPPAGTTTPPSPAPAGGVRLPSTGGTPVALTLRDGAIVCVCPPGVKRLTRDLVKIVKDNQVSWFHLPCVGNAPIKRSDALTFLGSSPSASMLQRAQNFAQKFICDGCSCEQMSLADFFMCRKCCSWQHGECMIFGEKGDKGGPVCNLCYMNFLLNQEEIVKWQRRRLLFVAQEALEFLLDDDTLHDLESREFCMRFFRGFMRQNGGYFVRFVLQRRGALEILLKRGIIDPRYFPDIKGIERLNSIESSMHTSAFGTRSESDHGPDTIAVSNPGTKIAVRRGRTPIPLPRARNPSPVGPNGEKRSHRAKNANGSVLATSSAAVPKAAKPKKAKRVAAKPRVAKRKVNKSKPAVPVTASKKRPRAPSSEPQVDPQHKKKKTEKEVPISKLLKSKDGLANLLGIGQGPRKSARMSAVSKKPQYTVDQDEDDDEEEQDMEMEDDDEEEQDVEMESDDERLKKAKAQLASSRAPRKSINMAEVMKKPFTPADPDDDGDDSDEDDSDEGDSEEDDYNEEDDESSDIEDEETGVPVDSMDVDEELNPQQATPAAKDDLDDDFVDSIMGLCNTVLWREYRNLPSASAVEPPKRPSAGWTTECDRLLDAMVDVAGSEATMKFLKPVLDTTPRDHDEIIEALNGLAQRMLRQGPWAGRPENFGLLAEVLGIAQKGVYWQGY